MDISQHSERSFQIDPIPIILIVALLIVVVAYYRILNAIRRDIKSELKALRRVHEESLKRIEGELDEPDDRNPPTRLDVTMPDGEKIVFDNASDTFVEVIKKLGRREVKGLNLKINGKDLMSTSEDDQQRIKLGGYYINVGTPTSRKKKILEDIASRLGVTLEVEIIPK